MSAAPAPGADRKPLISPAQTFAGAAAAVTSAVVGSYLGVAGTLIGAGLASIVSTIASALYGRSITAASSRVRKVAPAQLPLPERLKNLPWKYILIPAAMVFAIAVVVLTATEALANKPLSAAVTGRSSHGTTLSHLAEGNGGDPAPAPATTSTPTSTATSTPTDTPTSTSTDDATSTPSSTATSTRDRSTATTSPSGRSSGSSTSSRSATSTSTRSRPAGTASSSKTKAPSSTPTSGSSRSAAPSAGSSATP